MAEIRNRQAYFEFFIEDKYDAGMVLAGTEVKSLREGRASFNDSYCYFNKNELFVKSLHIGEYSHGTANNHDPIRERKLLLNKKELKKIEGKIKDKGMTIIPLRIFFSEKGIAKMEIGLGKGKKIIRQTSHYKSEGYGKRNEKIFEMRTAILSIIAALEFINASAQTLTGSWYGKADVMMAGASSNYLTEMVLKQKGNEVEGVFGYYFKDAYQSFFIRGNYNKSTRLISIKNLPLLFYASPTRNGIECPMNFSGTLMVSRAGSSLKGNFYTDPKYKYTCPDLRVSMIMDESENNQDSVLRNSVAGRKFWKPQAEDVVVNANKPVKNEDTLKAIATVATDSVSKTVETVAAPVVNAGLTEEFGKRKAIYEKDIVVYDDSVLVSFYDNGDIDDDTISVFLNKKPILVKRGLSSRALNIYISLDSAVDVNELSMFAENLGKYPPNTALMVISDGVKRYEVYLSASLTQNASIRLRRPRR